MNSKMVSNLSLLTGRILLSAMFIMAGFSKLGSYAGTAAYMESFGLPGALLPAVIALEIGGGLAVLAGLRTRPAALALGAFTFIAAVVFHSDFSQPMQSILFSKNIALVGGFLVLCVQGPGEWSLDSLNLTGRARA